MPSKHQYPPVEERFWSRVRKTSDCWLWTGGGSSAGYGQIGRDGKRITVHRLSWELHNGPIPDGLWVLHKCDNPPCVNPDHLFLGTHQDNMTDKKNKGRAITPGKPGINSKLNAEQVIAIRAKYSQGGVTMKALGQQYGVRTTTICAAITKQNWRHL